MVVKAAPRLRPPKSPVLRPGMLQPAAKRRVRLDGFTRRLVLRSVARASAVTQVSIGTSGIASVPPIVVNQSQSTAILSPSTGGALAIGAMSIGYGGIGESDLQYQCAVL